MNRNEEIRRNISTLQESRQIACAPYDKQIAKLYEMLIPDPIMMSAEKMEAFMNRVTSEGVAYSGPINIVEVIK